MKLSTTKTVWVLWLLFAYKLSFSQNITFQGTVPQLTNLFDETQVTMIRNSGVDQGYMIFYPERIGGFDYLQALYFNLSHNQVGSTINPLGTNVKGAQYDDNYEWGLVSDNSLGFAGSFELSDVGKDAVGFFTVNTSTGAITEVLDEKVAVGDSDANGHANVTILNNGNLVLAYSKSLAQGGALSFDIINPNTSVYTVSNVSVTSSTQRPDLIALSDGGFFLTFIKDLGSGNFAVQGQRYNASGTAVGSLVSAITNLTQGNLHGIKLSNGNVLLQESGKIRVLDFSGNSTPTFVTGEISIAPGDLAAETNYYVSPFDDGGFVAVFTGSDEATFRNLGYRIFDNNGNAATDVQIDITARDLVRAVNDPTVTTFSNGGFLAVFKNDKTVSTGANKGLRERVTVANMHPIIDLDSDNSSGGTGKAFTASTLNGQSGGVAIADTDVLVTDADGEDVTSIVIQISNHLDGANEFLTLNSATNITISGSGTKTITLTDAGSATKSNFQDALAGIRYENTTAANTTTRTISFTVTDNASLSSSATASVAISSASTGSAPTSVLVAATVFLEGAYNGTSMNTTINGSIPTTQPYSINGHSGGSAGSIPAGAVDWVLVELREAGSAAAALNATKKGSTAGFLMSDGTIKATDGTSDLTLSLSGNTGSDFFVVVYHRNHLPIMSASAVAGNSGTLTIDFTGNSANTHQTTTALVSIAGGKFAMPAGDADGDGDVDATDLATWQVQNGVVFSYNSTNGDFNLDGEINAVDRNDFQQKNTSKTSQVPGT
ncbi:MAG: hypothetical protein HEP71_33625 [Roseivirga sp.]|nr:hypothetical protein [Roseivirga sp.]